jgi:uncharacterized membrane protein
MNNLPERVEQRGNESDTLRVLRENQELTVQSVRLEGGPLPAADVLGAYEAVMPGLADRIVRMAEREQAHVHGLESAEVEQPYKIARRGQVLGLMAVALFLIFAGILAVKGSPVAAAAVASVDIVAVLVVFITGASPAKEPAPSPDQPSPGKQGQRRSRSQRRQNQRQQAKQIPGRQRDGG